VTPPCSGDAAVTSNAARHHQLRGNEGSTQLGPVCASPGCVYTERCLCARVCSCNKQPGSCTIEHRQVEKQHQLLSAWQICYCTPQPACSHVTVAIADYLTYVGRVQVMFEEVRSGKALTRLHSCITTAEAVTRQATWLQTAVCNVTPILQRNPPNVVPV
jgi:hypothetical protein